MSTEHVFPDPASIPLYAAGRLDDSGSYRDLCSNCNHAETCVGLSGPKRPIFFCEQFDVSSTVPVSETIQTVPTQSRQKQNASGRIGLCMNCDNAGTCNSPELEGGVWHCEEYQ